MTKRSAPVQVDEAGETVQGHHRAAVALEAGQNVLAEDSAGAAVIHICGGGPLSLDQQYAMEVFAEAGDPQAQADLAAYSKGLDVGEAERETVAVHTVVTDCRRRIKEAEWELGSAIKLVRDHGLWSNAPLNLDSYDAYLQHPDVDLSPQKARRLIRCVERYKPLVAAGVCTDEDLAEMGTSKGDMLGKALDRDPDSAGELIAKAGRVSKTELRKELRRLDPDHPHSGERLDFLEEVSAKLCGMAGHLPDQVDPVAALAKLREAVDAAASEYQTTFCQPSEAP